LENYFARGTLVHYNLLNEFAEEDMFSVDEENSTEQLKLEGDWSRYKDDLAYAEEAWEQVKRIRGIDDDAVLNVECFVTNTGVGYAGQFDLLYVDDDSNVVLSDIKTSNADYAPYEKHKLQLTAYANALELDVDILEVLIIHPDSETWKISHNTDWTEELTGRKMWTTSGQSFESCATGWATLKTGCDLSLKKGLMMDSNTIVRLRYDLR
jgi:hypothetical protein